MSLPFPSNTSRNETRNATRLQTTPYTNIPISQRAIPSFLWVTQSGLASPPLTHWKQTAKISCGCLVAARAHQAQSQPIIEHSLPSLQLMRRMCRILTAIGATWPATSTFLLPAGAQSRFPQSPSSSPGISYYEMQLEINYIQ